MTRDEVFPSKYLKAADLKGKPHIVTIESAPYETLKSLDGKETQKIVLYFKNARQVAAIERNELRRRLRRHGLSRHGRLAGTTDRVVSDQDDHGRKNNGLHPHPSAFRFTAGGSSTTAATAVRACK